jgi:uncharacterized membrane protein
VRAVGEYVGAIPPPDGIIPGHEHPPSAPAAVTHTHAGPAASRRTRRLVTAVLVPAAIATLIGLIALWPDRPESTPAGDGQRALGTVTALAEQACGAGAAPGERCGTASVRITEGPGAPDLQTVDLPTGPGAPRLAVGDDVVLLFSPDAVAGGRAWAVVDLQRSAPMLWLVALTVAVILAFGRWRGLASLAGLAVSFAVLLLFVLPAILDGAPPLLVAVVGAAAIMFAALYLTHGVTVHTSVAVAGTLVSLVLTGVLGAAFTGLLRLSGVSGEESAYLSVSRGDLDLRGLLLAGIVIGALGVLDDVTVTQAVTVAEMAAGGQGSRWQLYRAAIRVGRAHVGSAVNTIVLAYAGASLPLLLLISAGGRPVGDLLTGEFLASEILRSAVGTVGLVASVPITTALAVLVAESRPAHPRHAR